MNERLKELRKSRDLTQKQFAEQLGVDRSLVVKWESGDRPIPLVQMKVICAEFNASLEWLRDGKGEMMKRPMTRRELLVEEACQIFESLSPLKQKIAMEVTQHFIETGKWEGSW